MSEDDLNALTQRIREVVTANGRCKVTQPPEIALFRSMSDEELHEFAARQRWIVVPALGRDQVEFFAAADGQQV